MSEPRTKVIKLTGVDVDILDHVASMAEPYRSGTRRYARLTASEVVAIALRLAREVMVDDKNQEIPNYRTSLQRLSPSERERLLHGEWDPYVVGKD